MTSIIYILSTVVFIQFIAIIYLIGREVQNDKKQKEMVSNQSKIIEILRLHTDKLNMKAPSVDNIHLN